MREFLLYMPAAGLFLDQSKKGVRREKECVALAKKVKCIRVRGRVLAYISSTVLKIPPCVLTGDARNY